MAVATVAVFISLIGLASALLFPAAAGAHALAGKQDLPIPEWLFAWGASLVLIVSFVALSVAWRSPRLEDGEWRPLGRAWGLIVNRATEVAAGAIGVFLLGVTIWAGLYGTEAPDRNFSITFVFVTVWLGFAILSVFLGDIFRAFNPWRAIARVTASGFTRLAGQAGPPPLPYPEGLGRWPAAAGLLGFLWLELIYGASGLQTVGLTPRTVAIAALFYSAYTFVGMALYGIEKWCDRGETFSVYFGMFGRLAPLEVRDGELGRRRWLAGATGWATVPGSVAVVLITIAGTTFDGAQEGLLNGAIGEAFDLLFDQGNGLDPVLALRLANSLFMALTLVLIVAIYWGGVKGMGAAGSKDASLRSLGRSFAHSFIPIAFAYLFAHYFSLVLFQEQAQFTYLLSDPLGDGSDLFGTGGSGIDYGLIGAEAVWYVQVAALVVGHVAALVMGHDRALSEYRDVGRATQSQYWMLALMVSFTVLGLMLLSSANG
ncbi:MAG: fenitrothion hydrolase [Actinomycetota bacterium]|nr:fenitrothion hydrolase [Actinomycetota bacterium]